MEWSGRSLVPVFGPLEPHEVTKDLVAEYITNSKKAKGTIWTELNHLRMTLNWAEREGLIKGFVPFPLPSRPPPKTDYLSKDQVNALLSAAKLPHVGLFIVLAVGSADPHPHLT